MKNFVNILTLGIIIFSIISCKSKKINSITESKFYTDSIYSEFLGEYRKHNVYLPKEFNNIKKYSIVYATDGETDITDKKSILDSLINNKIIKPVIFIASFCNKKIADSTSVTNGYGEKINLNYRNFEYINDYASITKDSLLKKRFQNHMSYFENELISKIETDFKQNLNKKDRYFYGVSNGAGFGMSLLNNNPNIIGTYICFSTFGGDITSNIWDKNVKYPKLYLRYGSKEPPFLKENAEFIKSKYTLLGIFADIKEFEGGHNNKYWSNEFTEIISEILKVN